MRRALLIALALLGGCREVIDLGGGPASDAGPTDAGWPSEDANPLDSGAWPDAALEVDAGL